MRTREEKMGVAKALFDRLNSQRIPYLLDLEKRPVPEDVLDLASMRSRA